MSERSIRPYQVLSGGGQEVAMECIRKLRPRNLLQTLKAVHQHQFRRSFNPLILMCDYDERKGGAGLYRVSLTVSDEVARELEVNHGHSRRYVDLLAVSVGVRKVATFTALKYALLS